MFTSNHWYERGAAMRVLAEQMKDFETKAILLRLAYHYDQMGDREYHVKLTQPIPNGRIGNDQRRTG